MFVNGNSNLIQVISKQNEEGNNFDNLKQKKNGSLFVKNDEDNAK